MTNAMSYRSGNYTLVPCPRCGSSEHSLCGVVDASGERLAMIGGVRPFRCPVCLGEGRVPHAQGTGTVALTKTCPACAGRCIVWGPPR